MLQLLWDLKEVFFKKDKNMHYMVRMCSKTLPVSATSLKESNILISDIFPTHLVA